MTQRQFQASVDITSFDREGRLLAKVRIIDTATGKPLRFIGLPAGMDLEGASVDGSGTEARLAMVESSIVDSGPLPAPRNGPHLPVQAAAVPQLPREGGSLIAPPPLRRPPGVAVLRPGEVKRVSEMAPTEPAGEVGCSPCEAGEKMLREQQGG